MNEYVKSASLSKMPNSYSTTISASLPTRLQRQPYKALSQAHVLQTPPLGGTAGSLGPPRSQHAPDRRLFRTHSDFSLSAFHTSVLVSQPNYAYL